MRKIKKCLGCGVKLQDENILNIGYTINLENDFCMRCFRLKNYGEYESVSSTLVHYEEILKSINNTKALVLYVVDVLNLPYDLNEIRKYLKNDIILVLNKKDLLPSSIKDEKIMDYINNLNLGFNNIIIVSSEKNYNFDSLYKIISKSKNVYVVGYTNAGKSSLINKLISDYGDNVNTLTISPLPTTTLSKVTVKINDNLTINDTPGIIDNTNIINFVDKKLYKKLNSKREIKPRTYQLYKNQSLLIDDLIRIDYLEGEKNSFIFYIPNEIKIRRISHKSDKLCNLAMFNFNVLYNEDLVINGLGFVKIVLEGKIRIYLNKDIKVFTRKSII